MHLIFHPVIHFETIESEHLNIWKYQ